MKSFSQFLIENKVAESLDGYIVESEIDPETGQIVSKRGEAAKFQNKVEKEIKNKTNKNKFVKGQTTGTQTPKRGATTIRTSNQLNLFTNKPDAPKEVPVKTTYKTRVNKPVVDSNPTIPGIDDGQTKTKTNRFSKKLSGSGKIVFKPKPGEKTASNLIVKQQTPGTNVSISPSKTNITKNTSTVTSNVTSNVTNTKNPITVNDYKGVSSSGSKIKTTKPQVTTNVTSPKKFKSFLDRVLVSTGVKTDPKYKAKFTTPSSKVTVSGAKSGTNKVLSDVSKKALRSNIFKGLGRFAGGAFAAKDAYDKARDEKLLGRSRTSQILGGLARGAGGYIGGALGATLGTLAGGGIGSFALGTGGAITGYNLGSKLGDFLYDKGRKLATGETKLPGKKTFKKFKDNITTKVKGLDLRNLGRMDKDKK